MSHSDDLHLELQPATRKSVFADDGFVGMRERPRRKMERRRLHFSNLLHSSQTQNRYEKGNDPTRRLRAELRDAGLEMGDDLPVFVSELLYLLQPEVHEGRVTSCGIVSLVVHRDLAAIGRVVSALPVAIARRVADGHSSFVLVIAGVYRGLLVLQRPLANERDLLRFQELLSGLVAVADSSGRTEVVTVAGVFIHEFRRWRRKPPVTYAIGSVTSHFGAVNVPVLKRITEFCYYTLSPVNTGATLVWYVTSPSDLALLQARVQTDAAPLAIGLRDDSEMAPAHAILLAFRRGGAVRCERHADGI